MSRIVVITGDGKGKTTSALGMVCRALGNDLSVAVISFMKMSVDTGEYRFFKDHPNIIYEVLGEGFTPPQSSARFANHKMAAERALDRSMQLIVRDDIDLLVMDEVCGAISKDLIGEDSLIDLCDQLRDNQILICTGRGAPEKLINRADTVSIVNSLKHAYEIGISATPGVEF